MMNDGYAHYVIFITVAALTLCAWLGGYNAHPNTEARSACAYMDGKGYPTPLQCAEQSDDVDAICAYALGAKYEMLNYCEGESK